MALTRASEDVRIYTSLEKPSRFVTEIQHLEKLEMEPVDSEIVNPCPKCIRWCCDCGTASTDRFMGAAPSRNATTPNRCRVWSPEQPPGLRQRL